MTSVIVQEAENLLATVTDRRAVPSILKLFPIDRPEAEQLHRLRLLRQVDDPSSSRAIANQAVQTRFESVHREAIEILKKRPPRDYAGNLVEMIHGTIRYEVQPVTGHDSRGALAIDAPRFRMVRTYDVPHAFELASVVPRLCRLRRQRPARGGTGPRARLHEAANLEPAGYCGQGP